MRRIDKVAVSQNTQQSPIIPVLVIMMATIICLAPFVTKAFHIDDTLFIWAAQHIQTQPIDFYGFTANWYGTEMPMSLINKNPPFVSYYIAIVALLFGWSEVALHLAFLIPAAGLSLGIYSLARQLCPRPQMAALIAVFTPAFLVSSTNIMSDTMMLAFYVWAVSFWLHGLEKDSMSHLFVAAIFIALSALTKYFGMTLVPLLIVYSLMIKRGLGRWIVFFAIPVLILAGYQWLTYTLYGHGLLSDAASYAIAAGSAGAAPQFLTKALTGLAFTGGCLAAVAFFAPLMWSRRILAVGGVLLTLSIATLLVMGTVGELCLRNADGIQWGLVIQFGLFIMAGVHILALAVTDLWKNRDASSLMLFLWIFGTFLFATFVNWTVNARTVFPMIPAAGILVMRRFDMRTKAWPLPSVWLLVVPLIPAAFIALSVTWADYSLAGCQRSAARMIDARFHNYPHKLWFQGHWGFQHYMEAIGGKALDFKYSVIRKGDIIVVPSNNCFTVVPQSNKFRIVEGLQSKTSCRWIGTMQSPIGTGFYSDVWGPLPFAVGNVPPERYLLFKLDDFDSDRRASPGG